MWWLGPSPAWLCSGESAVGHGCVCGSWYGRGASAECGPLSLPAPPLLMQQSVQHLPPPHRSPTAQPRAKASPTSVQNPFLALTCPGANPEVFLVRLGQTTEEEDHPEGESDRHQPRYPEKLQQTRVKGRAGQSSRHPPLRQRQDPTSTTLLCPPHLTPSLPPCQREAVRPAPVIGLLHVDNWRLILRIIWKENKDTQPNFQTTPCSVWT